MKNQTNFNDQKLTISERIEIVDKMIFSEKEINDIYENDLIDSYEKKLKPIELHFFINEDNNLNSCDNCGIIKNTWNTDEFNWDCDHDLKGNSALCTKCYMELDCKPLKN